METWDLLERKPLRSRLRCPLDLRTRYVNICWVVVHNLEIVLWLECATTTCRRRWPRLPTLLRRHSRTAAPVLIWRSIYLHACIQPLLPDDSANEEYISLDLDFNLVTVSNLSKFTEANPYCRRLETMGSEASSVRRVERSGRLRILNRPSSRTSHSAMGWQALEL